MNLPVKEETKRSFYYAFITLMSGKREQLKGLIHKKIQIFEILLLWPVLLNCQFSQNFVNWVQF